MQRLVTCLGVVLGALTFGAASARAAVVSHPFDGGSLQGGVWSNQACSLLLPTRTSGASATGGNPGGQATTLFRWTAGTFGRCATRLTFPDTPISDGSSPKTFSFDARAQYSGITVGSIPRVRLTALAIPLDGNRVPLSSGAVFTRVVQEFYEGSGWVNASAPTSITSISFARYVSIYIDVELSTATSALGTIDVGIDNVRWVV